MNHRNFSNQNTFLALLMLVMAATSFSVCWVLRTVSCTTLCEALMVFCSFWAACRFWLKYLQGIAIVTNSYQGAYDRRHAASISSPFQLQWYPCVSSHSYLSYPKPIPCYSLTLKHTYLRALAMAERSRSISTIMGLILVDSFPSSRSSSESNSRSSSSQSYGSLRTQKPPTQIIVHDHSQLLQCPSSTSIYSLICLISLRIDTTLKSLPP